MARLNTFVGALAGLVFAAGISQAQIIIYQDDFSGGTGNLAGEAPDVRPGSETWIAQPGASLPGGAESGAFRADGTSITSNHGGSGGSFLPFAPSAGNVYKLSASINVAADDAGYISIGFSNGIGDRYILIANGGAFIGGNEHPNPDIRTYLGVSVAGQAEHDNLNIDGLSEIDIILDATDADAALWTMEFIINGGSSVHGPLPKTFGSGFNNGNGSWADISHVGISHNNAAGVVESFELSIIPEPNSAALLLGVSALALLHRRRRH